MHSLLEHSLRELHGAPSCLRHVPVAFAQDRPVPQTETAQHVDSTQLPLAQSPAAEQLWPLARLQAPAPSHASQRPSGSAFRMGTLVQVPGVDSDAHV